MKKIYLLMAAAALTLSGCFCFDGPRGWEGGRGYGGHGGHGHWHGGRGFRQTSFIFDGADDASGCPIEAAMDS